ncbi:MAG TPA: hypothetical protein DCS49_05590, partial [Gammaproteobacteria bacterium]|nr:hypothetical protein [Gammaproteobacteria bacterium]
VVWCSIKARRQKKNRVKETNALIKVIQNQKSQRIEQLKLVLSQQYFLSGDALEKKTAELYERELNLYKSQITLFIQQDSKVLKQMPIQVEQAMDACLGLVPENNPSSADNDQDETLTQTVAETAQKVEELVQTMRELNNEPTNESDNEKNGNDAEIEEVGVSPVEDDGEESNTEEADSAELLDELEDDQMDLSTELEEEDDTSVGVEEGSNSLVNDSEEESANDIDKLVEKEQELSSDPNFDSEEEALAALVANGSDDTSEPEEPDIKKPEAESAAVAIDSATSDRKDETRLDDN